MTAAEIVIAALRKIGVIGAGVTPSTDEAEDGLQALQQMLASWTAEELTIFATNTQAVTLAASDPEYTLATRPTKILSADIVTGGMTFPVRVAGPEEWAAFIDKTAVSALTKILYCDYAYPDATITVAPKPAATATLNLYCLTDLATLASGETEFALPPGFERAVIFNLAVDLWPEFSRKPIDQAVAAIATQSKQTLQALNASNREGVGVRQLGTQAAAE